MNEVTTTLAIPSAIHGERIWAARRRARPRDPRRAGYSPSCVGDALRDLRRAVPSSPTDEIHNGRARRVFQHDDMPEPSDDAIGDRPAARRQGGQAPRSVRGHKTGQADSRRRGSVTQPPHSAPPAAFQRLAARMVASLGPRASWGRRQRPATVGG